jgi:hypothetical protein
MPWILSPVLLLVCGCARNPAASSVPLLRGQLAPSPAAAVSIAPVETPRATASATAPAPVTPESTPRPAATAAAVGPLEHVDAMALGGVTPVRSEPSMDSGQTLRTLADREPVVILREVRGERWVVGDQTWAMAIQDWTNLWYQIDGGGYVYAGFVFIPRPGELDAINDRSGVHSVDVDLNNQTATALVGDRAVHVAAATTGKPGYETPAGDHTVVYRKFNETMTSAQAAINDPHEQYDVKNVLYTQYFDNAGDALHLNYWQPESVFGHVRTSHGCVGLQLHDAQFFWLFDSSGTQVKIHPVPSAAPATAVSGASATATPQSRLTAPSPTPTPTLDPTLMQRFTLSTPTPVPGLVIPPPPPPPVFPTRAR